MGRAKMNLFVKILSYKTTMPLISLICYVVGAGLIGAAIYDIIMQLARHQ